jgi:hypothetical protein
MRVSFVHLLRLSALCACICSMKAGLPFDDGLEPDSDPMEGAARAPYEAFLTQLFFGEHSIRKCQVLFIPSFQAESAVYVVWTSPQESTATVIVKQARKSIWYQMTKTDGENGHSDSLTPEAKLSKADSSITTTTRPIGRELAAKLQRVWSLILSKPRSPLRNAGEDGERIHVAQYEDGHGYRWAQASGPGGARRLEFWDLAASLRAFGQGTMDVLELDKLASRLLVHLEAPDP